ncbi:hypothetical protein K492DRAFT_127176 [Lichtheimia hyalospora FSU 10163]|nr:hypothetical protein K492DRAFT_127176 [Lichtheimia hyalospora FSU 10163]
MSWSGSYAQTYMIDQNKLVQAEQEYDQFIELIIERCRVKCIPTHYHEPDLNKGEMVCIDRCVYKYGEFQRLLAKKMEEKDKEREPVSFSSSSFASTPSSDDMPSTL